MKPRDTLADIIFSGGCFWSLEAVFQHIRGVRATEVGYTWMEPGLPAKASSERFPALRMEVVRVTWDTSQLELSRLLEIFFSTTSPTLIRWDLIEEFSSSRSGIFVEDNNHLPLVLEYLEALRQSKSYDLPLHTQVFEGCVFEPAADTDQDFYLRNPSDGFCRSIVAPKLAKLVRCFPENVEVSTS